jgi:methyl-accepting chemotaxis protein
MNGGTARKLRHLSDWPLRVKIYALIALGLVAAIGVGVSGLTTAAALSAQTGHMYEHNLLPSQQLDRVRADMKDLRIGILNYVVSRTDAAMQTQSKKVDAAVAAFGTDMTAYRATTRNPVAAQQLDEVWGKYIQVGKTLMQYGPAKDWASYERVRDAQVVPLAQQADKLLVSLIDEEQTDAAASLSRATKVYQQRRVLLIAGLCLATALGLLFATFMARQIVGSLNQVVNVMRMVAGGDLAQVVRVDSADEVGVLARAVNETVTYLRTAVAV